MSGDIGTKSELSRSRSHCRGRNECRIFSESVSARSRARNHSSRESILATLRRARVTGSLAASQGRFRGTAQRQQCNDCHDDVISNRGNARVQPDEYASLNITDFRRRPHPGPPHVYRDIKNTTELFPITQSYTGSISQQKHPSVASEWMSCVIAAKNSVRIASKCTVPA